MPSQPEAQGDILKEFREGTFLSSLDIPLFPVDIHRFKLNHILLGFFRKP